MQTAQSYLPQGIATPTAGLLWLGFAVGSIVLVAGPVRSTGISVAIGLLTLFVAATTASFSLRYMRADSGSVPFFLTMSALVASVLAFVFTADLIVFAATWCASGWLLAALVGHARNWDEASAAARRARTAFLLGDCALLAALAIVGWHSGSTELGAALAAAGTLSAFPATIAALLLTVAAAARCALPPFSGWLLSSMTAPTPVSALMHAGLVNAGGFLLIRFAPVMEAAPAARFAAVTLGLCGAIYGMGIMMVRPDVKRSLAGSTISQMGFMIMSCGLGAYAAALWHIIAHGLFKAWLFLGSGSTVGMKVGRAQPPVSGRTAILIGSATVGLALVLLSSHSGDARLVPLLLGLATALTTLTAALAGNMSIRSKAIVLGTIIVLVAFHGAGLALAETAVGADGPDLVPSWALLVLVIAFLGAWAWQQACLSGGKGLPLPLYVHLINAGALPASTKGAAK